VRSWRGGAPVAQALRSLGDGLVDLVAPLLAALALLAEALAGYVLAMLALRGRSARCRAPVFSRNVRFIGG
jgi:hypothetical protein